ncbi:MAG: GWxTD domain-containing protein [Candidatus Delongbacteria bacterium]|nr:GWxTD domain-containing protein [Candidatus Delongbacteria bacterium]
MWRKLFILIVLSTAWIRADRVSLEPVLYYDYTQFNSLDSLRHPYLELYLLVLTSSLDYQPISQGFESRFQIVIRFHDLQGHPVFQDSLQGTHQVADTSRMQLGEHDLRIYPRILAPGDYRISIELQDKISAKSSLYQDTLRCSAYPRDSLSLSGIQLAKNITAEEGKSLLHKSGYRIIPNILLTYTQQDTSLYYFFEIYGSHGIDQADSVDIRHRIVNMNREPIQEKSSRVSISNRNLAMVGVMDIGSLESGRYALEIEIIHDQDTLRQSKRFYNIKPTESRIYPISDQRLDEIYSEIKPIATDEELALFLQLDGKDKKVEFLKDFWKKRDPTPSTSDNETLMEYYRNLEYVKKSFKPLNNRNPVETDRGKIYLKYGAPDEVQRYPNESGKKPYEIWYYYREGKQFFVFADMKGVGDYSLVHSTWPGEYYDDGWERKIMSH